MNTLSADGSIGHTWHIGMATLAQAAPPVAGRSDGGGTTQQGAESAPLGGTGSPGGGGQPQSPFGGMGFMFILLFFFVAMMLMSALTGRKEKKRRAEMLSSLKRHDRVQTIGGLIGSVAEVRDDEVVLKIDESTNTKVRVVRSAVQAVLKRSGEEIAPAGSDARS